MFKSNKVFRGTSFLHVQLQKRRIDSLKRTKSPPSENSEKYSKSAVNMLYLTGKQPEHVIYNTIFVTLTGWSASSSDPYIKTLCEHLSNSDIFLGNQGTQSRSAEDRMQVECIEYEIEIHVQKVCQCLKRVKWRSLAFLISPDVFWWIERHDISLKLEQLD